MEKIDLDFLNKQYHGGFSQIKISVSSQLVENNSEVLDKIKKFSPNDGWISLQSTPAKRWKDDFDSKDEYIIAGEFYNANGTSLSIRFDGERWILYTYRENDEGETVIKRNAKQLSKIDDNTYLNYDVCYKFDSDLGYRPYCSAFTGFTEEKND